MSHATAQATESEYTIRPYRPADADRFRSLYESVWGTEKGREWFDWRFAENPRSSEVTMVLAETDGRLVGAEPLVPYRLRAGDRVIDAFQPVDWIVHPEYRRQGVFSAMTERLVDRAETEASLLFNFPNEQLLPGVRKFDWIAVDTVAVRYRVQDAGAVARLNGTGSSRSTSAAASVGSPLVRGGLGVLDRLRSAPSGIAVDRVEGVPAGILTDLYAANRPDRIHVPRDEAFLEWRFANPRWETTTYVARRDGEPVASVVAALEWVRDTCLVRLLDVQPMLDSDGDADAFEAIVRAVVGDYGHACVLKAPTGYFPGVLRRNGFVRDDGFPLSRVATTTYHAVRPLGGEGGEAEWPADGAADRSPFGRYDPTDSEDWTLALGDLDVA